jgi:hypothetical protein
MGDPTSVLRTGAAIPAHVDRVLSKPLRLGELRAALAKLAAPQDPPAAFVESA